ACRQRNRLLLLGSSDGFTEGSLNLGIICTHGRQKHASEPMQFGTPPAPFMISRLVLLPPLSPRALQMYDPQDARLQPLGLGIAAPSASSRLPDCRLFRPRSTKYLQLCHPKRCAPNRGEPLLQAANAQNSDASIVQLSRTPGVPLQQDYAQSGREPLQKLVRRLMRAYRSASSLVRSLPP